MGRTASHIALECGLQTLPNAVLIGEEIKAKNWTLKQIINYLKDIIIQRSKKGMNFGVFIVPEGLIEFIPEVTRIIDEMNKIFILHRERLEKILIEDDDFQLFKATLFQHLSEESKDFLDFLPPRICESILIQRDNHGLVHAAKIETEKLLIGILENELFDDPEYDNEFEPNSFYYGYEGRCSMPTNFDSDYCYALGMNATNLINCNYTGVMSLINNLKESPEKWIPGCISLPSLMHIEERNLKAIPCIAKSLVDLEGPMFKQFEKIRERIAFNNYYTSPGPINMTGSTNEELKVDHPFLVEMPDIQLDDNLTNFLESERVFAPKSNISPYGQKMMSLKIELPNILKSQMEIQKLENHDKFNSSKVKRACERTFPHLMKLNKNAEIIKIVSSFSTKSDAETLNLDEIKGELRLGTLFSGRQSSGANNICDGLLKFKEAATSANVKLFGFLKGFTGLMNNDWIEIKEETFKYYRNHGGMDYLGRYKDKLKNDEELAAALETVNLLKLDGLIIVGNSLQLNNAVYINEYFLRHGNKTKIITIPMSVSGSLIHHYIETSIGFDTASKVYSELVGNISTDAASAKKYWYFVRLMGKNSSQLVLEASLHTHPNIAVIAEEVYKNGISLEEIVHLIADLIERRFEAGKSFGTVIIPECLLTYLTQYNTMIKEIDKYLSCLTSLFKSNIHDIKAGLKEKLTPWTYELFNSMPDFFQKQIFTDTDIHGNINTSRLETEKLLAFLVEIEIKKRNKTREGPVPFNYVCQYFGYQGRSAFPTVFDCALATASGFVASILIAKHFTSYCVLIKDLSYNIEDWRIGAYPLISLMQQKEERLKNLNPEIPIFGVDLKSNSFINYKKTRKEWFYQDNLLNPGPIQHFVFDKNERSFTLTMNHKSYQVLIKDIHKLCNEIYKNVTTAQNEDFLNAVIAGLVSTNQIIKIMKEK